MHPSNPVTIILVPLRCVQRYSMVRRSYMAGSAEIADTDETVQKNCTEIEIMNVKVMISEVKMFDTG